MNIRLPALIISLIIITFFNVSNSNADSIQPTLESFSITPSAIDVSDGSKIVTINVNATDNVSVEEIRVTFRDPFGTIWKTGKFNPNVANASVSWELEVPETATEGEYRITFIVIIDSNGNSRTYYLNEIINMGFDYFFNVSNPTADSIQPTLESFSITPSAIDVSDGSKIVTINVNATDNVSVEEIRVTFRDPFGTIWKTGKFNPNVANASVSWELEVPETATEGEYRITFIVIIDSNGNSRTYYLNEIINMGFDYFFNVSNPTADSIQPTLESFSITPSAIDVSDGSKIVTINVNATDNVSVEEIRVTFRDPFGTIWKTGKFNPNVANASVSWELEVPETATEGEYRITFIVIIDSNGNSRTYYLNEIINMGFDYFFNVSNPTAETVFKDGREWMQLTDSINTSWNTLSGYCDATTGACNASTGATGTIYDGWTWARSDDVAYLFDVYIAESGSTSPISAPNPNRKYDMYEYDSTGGWGELFTNDFNATSSGSTTNLGVVGVTRDLNLAGNTLLAVMFNNRSSGGFDHAQIVDFRDPSVASLPYYIFGNWFFKGDAYPDYPFIKYPLIIGDPIDDAGISAIELSSVTYKNEDDIFSCIFNVESGSGGLKDKSKFSCHIDFDDEESEADTECDSNGDNYLDDSFRIGTNGACTTSDIGLTYRPTRNGGGCTGSPSIVCAEKEFDSAGNTDMFCDGSVGAEETEAVSCVVTIATDTVDITSVRDLECADTDCLEGTDAYLFSTSKLREYRDRVLNTDDNGKPNDVSEVTLFTFD